MLYRLWKLPQFPVESYLNFQNGNIPNGNNRPPDKTFPWAYTETHQPKNSGLGCHGRVFSWCTKKFGHQPGCSDITAFFQKPIFLKNKYRTKLIDSLVFEWRHFSYVQLALYQVLINIGQGNWSAICRVKNKSCSNISQYVFGNKWCIFKHLVIFGYENKVSLLWWQISFSQTSFVLLF